MNSNSDKKIVRLAGKKWILPEVVDFEQGFVGGCWTPDRMWYKKGFWYYRVVGWRPPKRGEWYLSGAIVQAWRAPNDLDQTFLVVERTEKAVRRSRWVPEGIGAL